MCFPQPFMHTFTSRVRGCHSPLWLVIFLNLTTDKHFCWRCRHASRVKKNMVHEMFGLNYFWLVFVCWRLATFKKPHTLTSISFIIWNWEPIVVWSFTNCTISISHSHAFFLGNSPPNSQPFGGVYKMLYYLYGHRCFRTIVISNIVCLSSICSP